MIYNQHNLNISKIASKSDARPEIAGVLFTATHTVATDGFRLIEMSRPTTYASSDFPKMSNNLTALSEVKPFIVNAKELKAIKIVKNKELPILENVAVMAQDEQCVTLATTDLVSEQVQSLKIVKGTYPDYRTIIPKDEPVLIIDFNGHYMAELCELLAGLNKRLPKITMKVYASDKPIVLEAKNNEQSGMALLMPIRS